MLPMPSLIMMTIMTCSWWTIRPRPCWQAQAKSMMCGSCTHIHHITWRVMVNGSITYEHPLCEVSDTATQCWCFIRKENGHYKCVRNVLHIPTITKNLVSIKKVVEQGMQMWLDQWGYFIKDFKEKTQSIAHKRGEGLMFILSDNILKSATFTKGKRE